jgi:NAD-dependent deacetylase
VRPARLPESVPAAVRSTEVSQYAATVAHWVREAQRIVLLSGAGMSAESGVPTFRDAQTGLWARFRPEDLATEAAFRRNPKMVWDWYAMRRQMVAQVQPNAGHHAVAAFQRGHPGRLTVVTQNVDGLHQRAGSPGVLALHGNIAEDQWLDRPRACCEGGATREGSPPSCAVCGNLRRPAVVWFGEMLPAGVLESAEEASTACDLMLVVGTSGVVYPAAGLARNTRGKVVVVNPEASDLDDAADVVLRGMAAGLLPQLLKE